MEDYVLGQFVCSSKIKLIIAIRMESKMPLPEARDFVEADLVEMKPSDIKRVILTYLRIMTVQDYEREISIRWVTKPTILHFPSYS